MTKKTFIGAKPTPENPDAWVETRVAPSPTVQNAPGEANTAETVRTPSQSSIVVPVAATRASKVTRITFEVDPELHRAIKVAAIEHDTTMVALILGVLQEKFGPGA